MEERRRNALHYAEAHFLLIAAEHARNALERLGGPTLSGDLAGKITVLRNLYEHWYKERASFSHANNQKARAGRSFIREHPDGVPWTFKYSNAQGFYISVLRLEDLWAELDSAEREFARIANDVLGPSYVSEGEDIAPRPMPIPFPLMGYPPPAAAPPADS